MKEMDTQSKTWIPQQGSLCQMGVASACSQSQTIILGHVLWLVNVGKKGIHEASAQLQG